MRSMQEARRKALGPVPGSLQAYGAALETNLRFGKSITNEDFYKTTLIDETGAEAVVLVSTPLCTCLNEATLFSVDATFKVVPRAPPCYQLLTIAAGTTITQ